MLTNDNIENLIEGIMRHGPSILSKCVSRAEELIQYQERLTEEFLDYEIPKLQVDSNNWLIPEEYKRLDIEEFLVKVCPEQHYDRLVNELELYQRYNMIELLKTMKYIVDTLRKHKIVWGVGRGSSVASYILFLIGVHKIDPIKYNLPISEFFKGENDG
jgi:DNA polymerase III alpha subunit